MAKGEKELGRYKKESNFVVINVGCGIATGSVVNDSLLHGNKGFTGEMVIFKYSRAVRSNVNAVSMAGLRHKPQLE